MRHHVRSKMKRILSPHLLARVTGIDFLLLRPRRHEQEANRWRRKFVEANKARNKLERLRSTYREDQVFFFKYIWRMFDFADWAQTVLEGERIDACVAHDTLALEAARRIRLRTGCVIIHDAVEFPDYSGRSGQMRQVFQRHEPEKSMLHAHHLGVIRSAKLVLVTTPGLLNWYVKQSGKEPVVVRNCIDFENPEPNATMRKDCGLTAGERILVYINSAFPGSGVDTILRALSYLPKDIHLVVSGRAKPPIEHELLALAESLSVGPRLHFVGERNPNEMTSYRSGGDLALVPLDPRIPNHQTCLPNRVFEAIMSRLPVICSNLPVVRSLVESYECGRAFDKDDPECIAAVISKALSDIAYLKKRTHDAAAILNWETESPVFRQAIERVLGSSPNRVVLLANRTIAVNQRMFRHSRTLADMGHRVTVLSQESPCPALRDERIKYVESGPLQ